MSNRHFRNGDRVKSFQRLTVTAILAASALLTAGCSGGGTQAAPAPSESAVAAKSSASGAPSQSATPSAAPSQVLAAGIVAKGVANDGKGPYLQTTIADADAAMQYNPAIADAAAKAHFSAADLAEAQKVIVRFIAEEAIDSTLNGGDGDVDAWWAAHKDQIHPSYQGEILKTLRESSGDKTVLATENWMKSKPDLSYVHGDSTPRVSSRTINPTALRFVEDSQLQGVMLDTNVVYSMKVTRAAGPGVQNSTGEVSFAAAKDPADGEWKIAGYNTAYHTWG